MKSTAEDYINEFKQISERIDLYILEIIDRKNYSLASPLSVELRKLFLSGQGNDLFRKYQSAHEINLSFPDRGKTLPPHTVAVTLDEYIDNMIFALQGRVVTRKGLIEIVADERGAHYDEKADILHKQSGRIMIPVGNPSKTGIHPQNISYLVQIGKVASKVIKEQIIHG